MAEINEQDLLDEIQFDIKEKDLIKGKLVLASLGAVSRETKRKALLQVAQADNDFAVPLLAGVIGAYPDLAETFPFIRETLFSKVLESPGITVDVLSQHNNRDAEAVLMEMAAEVPIPEAVPAVLGILKAEQDPKTIRAAVSALGTIGDPAAEGPLSEYLYSGDRELVMAAVEALGRLKTPGAIQHLSKRLGGDLAVDTLIMDILARVEAPETVEKLNETLASSKAEVRAAGKKKMLAVGATALRVLVRNLSGKNKDLVIHSLNVLGEMGDPAAVAPIRKLLHGHPEDPNIRFAAYEALGKLPLDKEAFSLAVGLTDSDGSVRSVAAKAVDRHFNPPLAAGLINMISGADSEAVALVHTILDAQCDRIVVGLWEEEAFRRPASDYLVRGAHSDIRSHFKTLLAEKGLGDLTQPTPAEQTDKVRLKVFAVDDSKMILNIYRSMLHHLGYEPCLFEFPASALEQVQKEKPAMVLTDLNMPDITGIDLAKGMRKFYAKDELPIVMVTTQDENEDSLAALAAGVNAIVQKPFTEEQIGAVLAEYLG
ncbi:MAG: response regulator [Deltaproteobacteria bacterium]|nr:response regulator [Deltaproteobacteria bacterium]